MADQKALEIAQAILTDRRGADYYADAEILADFLKGRFGSSHDAAVKTAAAILDDRRGADYYADAEILAEFLEGQLASE